MQIEHRTGAAGGALRSCSAVLVAEWVWLLRGDVAPLPRSIDTSFALETLDGISNAGGGGINDHAVLVVLGREEFELSDCASKALGAGGEKEKTEVGEDGAGLCDVGLDVVTKTVAYSCPCSGDMGRHSCIQSKRFWWLRNRNRAERARPRWSMRLD
jgi:hypothetical protein